MTKAYSEKRNAIYSEPMTAVAIASLDAVPLSEKDSWERHE